MSNLSKIIKKEKTINLGGRDYTLTLVNLNILADFQEYFIKQRISENVEHYKQIESVLDDEQKKDYREMLLRRDIPMSELDKASTSLAGARYLFWRCLNKHHPEISLTEAGALVTLGNLADIQSVIQGDDSEKNAEGVAVSK